MNMNDLSVAISGLRALLLYIFFYLIENDTRFGQAEIIKITCYGCFITTMIMSIGYVIGFIATGIVLWKSDFIFSSTKSEGKREPDENIIIDYYTQEVLYRGFFRHYIFVIEDLDRTDDPAVITDFLKELRKFSYMRMSKVHQNEMNKAFYDLFQMEEFPEECIEFMSFVHMDIPMMEKNLYIALNKDEVLRKKYVELINSLSVVSQEIIKNIQLMQTKYGYSEVINEKLFQQRDYETYVVSKTLKNCIFIFEKDKLDEIGETYKYIFNQSNYKVTQKYMMNNLEFMNWLVQEKAYEEADKTIQNYVAARQSSSLLKYVLGHMQEEQIVEYLSEISGFDGHESARFFVQSQDERKNLLVHPGIYNNCYEKLIDSGLKGWYTRIFKATKKNV